MAEEAAESQAERPRLRQWVPASVLEWPYLETVSWAAFFLVLTFAVYYLSGVKGFPSDLHPQSTVYTNHVSQANSLLHGHLDEVPKYSRYITEPALFNGKTFCRPLDSVYKSSGLQLPPDPSCKLYVQHAPGPALILLPGVVIFGREINQTLVSIVLGALLAPLVFQVARRLINGVAGAIWLTVLFMFGTIVWFTASNGGVWFFSHTAALLFLFLALYATIVRRNPLLAGVAVGAAFLCRPPVALSAGFFLIMFSDLWLTDKPDDGETAAKGRSAARLWNLLRGLAKRTDLRPLLQMAAGASLFVVFAVTFNYLRFKNPFEFGYTYSEQVHQSQLAWLYPHGTFNVSYIPRHIPVFLTGMPIFKSDPSYVIAFGNGMAIWATTPAFFYALFAGVKDRRLIVVGAGLLAISVAIIVSRAVSAIWDTGWAHHTFAYGWYLLPFWFMIAVALFTALRLRNQDKLLIACWVAIVPIALANFLFAAWGYDQFGYRYALDFYPFLFLLTARGIGEHVGWHQKGFILAGVIVNLWAVLWIYQFGPHQTFGWEWKYLL